MIIENPILWLANNLVVAYTIVVLVYIGTQWAVQFGYAQRSHQLTIAIMNIGRAIVDPVLKRIRGVVPPIGNFDLSPVILILGLQFALKSLGWAFFKLGLL